MNDEQGIERRCPDCDTEGRYEARVLINGRGVYTCPNCGTRWQNELERPSSKGLVIRDRSSGAS